MLKINLMGVLGGDAEIREVGDRKVINFNVAIRKDYKNADGTKVEKTDWVKAALWKSSNQSTKVADYLKKGKKVFIEGEPSVESYMSKEGGAKGQLVVNVKEIEFVD
jgi:single-strand DNA-binding protein